MIKIKLKLPAFPTTNRKKKLRAATAARKPLRIAATAEYDELAEPNMKLSRALLIVLVLHVVAVSGIIAFNAIKTRQGPRAESVAETTAKSETAKADGPSVQLQGKEATRREEDKAPHAVAAKSDHAKASSVPDSGKTYTVAKGDNPVAIAKKLKVSYDDLLALNHITDPRKLQIGQKLLIPAKTITKGKKSDE